MMDPKETALNIAADNAMMSTHSPGVRPLEVRVGYFEWIGPQSVFYFELGGDTEFHAHLLSFSRAFAPHNLGVEFYDSEGRLAAYLCPLREMEYEPDEESEHEAAFKLWREHLEENPDLLAFITAARDTLTRKEDE